MFPQTSSARTSSAFQTLSASARTRAPKDGPVLKGHHIRQIALLAAVASWAGIFVAFGVI